MINRRVQKGIERGEPFEIEVDGEKIVAFEGETVATVLMAAGHRPLRYTTQENQPRGVYCGIGLCHECMMVIDGIPHTRACQTPARPGCRVEVQEGLGKGGPKVGKS